jgi:hypothetical protein
LIAAYAVLTFAAVVLSRRNFIAGMTLVAQQLSRPGFGPTLPRPDLRD